MKMLAAVVAGWMASLASGVAAGPVTLESLLAEMVDRTAVARFPEPAYVCTQFSSYDRASTSPTNQETWFANGDASQYLRVEENGGRKEWVMVDAEGPGAVVRFWSANPKGTVRVYLDGAKEPVIEEAMTDMLGGKWVGAPLSQESSRGWNLYLPIPYAKHCKITSDADGFYYQVNVRTYEKSAEVRSLARGAMERARGQIARTNATLISTTLEENDADEAPALVNGQIEPGGTLELSLPEGPRAVAMTTVSLFETDLVQDPRSVVLQAEFDGEETVWVPIGDFLGCGVGWKPFHDRYRQVLPDGNAVCTFVMPYERRATLRLRNLGDLPVKAILGAVVSEWTWDERSMHFHATWKNEYPIHAMGGKGTEDWNYVEVTGKGVYVGDNLNVVNPVDAWWGEGDEKIYVDGETFPSHFGTGTEDYYGYAWCCPEVFEHPFHAQPRCDGGKLGNNWGYTSVTRTRSLDAIPFTKTFKFDMEVWHWAECDVAYAATAMFYARPGAVTNRKPDPAGAAAKVVVPTPMPPPFAVEGAIECEGMVVLAKSEGMPVGPQGGFGPKLWSGGEQLWVQGKEVGDFVELAVPAPDNSARTIAVYATKSWDYGIVRFSVNGNPAGADVDLFNDKARDVVNTGPIPLGSFEPRDGRFVLKVQVVGGNPKSEGTRAFFGLDCVTLGPAN